MKLLNLKSLIVLVFLIVASSIYFASVVPASPTIEITAEVVSRTSKSGPTGNTGILICKLKNGNTVMVETPPFAKARTGDQVMLRSYKRYLFGDKYHFGGKLIDPSATVSDP